jgi:hypothetical protein
MKLTAVIASSLALILCRPPFASAQDTSVAATPGAVTLEQLPERLQNLDDEIARKLDEVRALVESEVAAKHITEPIAQSLRWSLRTTATVGSAVDVRGIVSTMRVPTDNSALTQAVKELETTYAAAQTRRTATANDVAREIRRRVSEVIRTAAKPEDLQPLEAALAAANEALRRRTSLSGTEAMTAFTSAEQMMRDLRRLVEAETVGKPTPLGQAINQIRNDYRYGRDTAYESEVQARIDRVTQPFIAAAENGENEIARAITERKPSAEINAALTRFEDAAERLAQLSVGPSPASGQRDMRQIASNYRTLAKAIDGLGDAGDESVQTRLSEAKNAARQLGPKRSETIDLVITKLESQIAEAAAAMASERSEKLLPRIAAVKQPADLDAIVADVQRWSASMPRSNSSERESWNKLATQLATLRAAWATSSPTLLQQDRYAESEVPRTAYGGEVAALRKRIEREILSRILEAPELNAPPLAVRPLETAVETLCDDLVKNGDWRRLYDVLSARSAVRTNADRRSDDDTLTALRSFFTAQNLELAEQWADAVRTYKLVLRSASRWAPIKPAADRLKVLTKEHPEIAAAPAPAARSDSAEPQR